eukprot:403882_1
MFNICKESQNPKLEGIIQNYLKANQDCESQFLQHVQQSENAFFNHWKALNALRIQSQAQNWAKFMNQLQLISTSTPSNTTHSAISIMNHKASNGTGSGTVTPLPMNSARSTTPTTRHIRARVPKPIEEYKCVRPECGKIYTTKG